MNKSLQHSQIAAGFYGKHPEFGDFITNGLSQSLSGYLERWLNQMLPDLRDGVSDAWEAHYDSAPVMRIWIGSALTPEGRGFCGMMAAARDKVGRRFPLLAGVEGAAIAPPPTEPDQQFYDAIDGFLNGYARGDDDARAMAARFGDALLPGLSEADPLLATDFWASRPDGDVNRLWTDVALADTARALATRTYLWRSDQGSSALYVTNGLPGAAAFAWMMGAPYAAPGIETTLP